MDKETKQLYEAAIKTRECLLQEAERLNKAIESIEGKFPEEYLHADNMKRVLKERPDAFDDLPAGLDEVDPTS